MSILKRVFVGRPIATTAQEHQRLIKVVALAVFASDAISSTAYATEEILHTGFPTLLFKSTNYLVPIAILVALLLAIVITSFRTTVHAYPNGGGSYIVSRENIGPKAAMLAGASIMVDYVLTVAVSVSAGVAAIVSAFPELNDQRVWLCVGVVVLLTLANLRGMKESGSLFAAPTYFYVFMLAALIVVGLIRSFTGDLGPIPPNEVAVNLWREEGRVGSGLLILVLMRMFASGAVALTGVEAVADGVQAFKRPAAKNAATTLLWMGLILGSAQIGVSVLAARFKPTVMDQDWMGVEYQTVLAQLGEHIFGSGVFFYALQAATALILLLAANTAYADFPRVTSFIAQDGYLPRQFSNRGDRLVFSNGIIILAVAASALLIIFNGQTSNLIPLYAVGVFTCFTLAQFGMVRHHRRLRERGWKRNTVISAVGAATTFLVLLEVLLLKFVYGAWVVVVVVPIIILIFVGVKRHYTKVANALQVPEGYKPARRRHTVVVLVGRIHTGVLEAIAYARSLNPDHLVAMTIVTDEEDQRRIEEQWQHFGIDIPLEIVYSPYRELLQPTLRFIDQLDTRWEDDFLTVVIPEFVVRHWWEHILHNQSALFLKGRLLFRKGTVVTSVPYHVDDAVRP